MQASLMQQQPPLVTTTAATTYATSAGKSFTGKPHVLGNGTGKRIAVWTHEVVGKVTAFPRFDAGAGAHAAGTNGQQCEREYTKSRGLHDGIWDELFFVKESLDLGRECCFITGAEAAMHEADGALFIN